MALICTGYGCPRSFKCGKCIHNLSEKYTKGVNTVESLSTSGHGIATSTSLSDIIWDCGPNGRYKLFESLETESTDWHREVEFTERRINNEGSYN